MYIMKQPINSEKNKLSSTELICSKCNTKFKSQRGLSLHLTKSTKCGHRKRNKTNHPDIGCSSNCYQDDVDSIMTNKHTYDHVDNCSMSRSTLNNKSIKNGTSTTKNATNKVSNVTSNVSKIHIDSSNSIDLNKKNLSAYKKLFQIF